MSTLRYVRILIALSASALLVMNPAEPAAAYDNMYRTGNAGWDCTDGNFYPPNATSLFCQTDNDQLYYYIEPNIDANGYGNITSVLDNSLDSPTDLTVLFDSNPVWSGPAETDTIYKYDSRMNSDLLGITWCNDAVTTTKCDQTYVAFNSTTPLKKTICHESGHSVGLTHGSNASGGSGPNGTTADDDNSLWCMQRPASVFSTYYYGSHNVDEINDTY